jgi:mycothiol synthase
MTTQTIFHARAYAGEADIRPICELVNLVDAADRLDDSHDEDDARQWLHDPSRDPQRDLRLWEDATGRLVGFASAWVPPPGDDMVDGNLYFRIHPEARRQGLESAVIAWGAARLREAGRERNLPARLYAGAREHDAYSRAVLEQHGLRPVRYFYKMVRPLDQPIPAPVIPAGFTLRSVAGDADVEKWVDCFNWSFIDHWGFHPTTVERRRHRMSGPHYRPELDLVLEAPDGQFAAFVFCAINPADNARNDRREGWIMQLGTRRGYRNQGLGRALLLAGMQAIQAAGMDTAALGVDAENPTGALRLYESVGFTVAGTDISHCKDL